MKTRELDEMTPGELTDLARACFDRVAGDDAPAFEESHSDDNLVRSYRWPDSGRVFQLIARLDPDADEAAHFGDVDLVAELANRVGYIELVYEIEDTAAWLSQVAPSLYVSASDAETRAWMRDAVTRIGPELLDRTRAFLRDFDEYSITIASSEIRIQGLADMGWDTEDWLEGPRSLPEYMQALDRIAAVMEAQLPDTYVACGHCGGRFNAAAAPQCPHCGAPI